MEYYFYKKLIQLPFVKMNGEGTGMVNYYFLTAPVVLEALSLALQKALTSPSNKRRKIKTAGF